MSTPPPGPVERHSLYPEPHRVGEWSEPAPRRRLPFLPLLALLAAVVAIIVAIQFGLSVGRDRGTETPVITNVDGQDINAIQAQPGTCLDEVPADGAVSRVTAVPCSVPHRAEVVSSYKVPGTEWPGRDEVERIVLDHCGEFIQPGFDASAMFKPGDWEDGVRWVAWLPTEASWSADERHGVCVAYRDGEIVGSFVAGTATFAD